MMGEIWTMPVGERSLGKPLDSSNADTVANYQWTDHISREMFNRLTDFVTFYYVIESTLQPLMIFTRTLTILMKVLKGQKVHFITG